MSPAEGGEGGAGVGGAGVGGVRTGGVGVVGVALVLADAFAEDEEAVEGGGNGGLYLPLGSSCSPSEATSGVCNGNAPAPDVNQSSSESPSPMGGTGAGAGGSSFMILRYSMAPKP